MNNINKSDNNDKRGNVPPNDEKDGDRKPPAVRHDEDDTTEEKESRDENGKAVETETSTGNVKTSPPPFTPSLLRSPSNASYSPNFVSEISTIN